MVDLMDPNALRLMMRILVVFAFAGSLFVLVDPEAYKKLNSILMKEYGLKQKLVPSLETEKLSLDKIILKNRKLFGAVFLLFSFALLTMY
ncbi:MAG: hypothetical protein FJZ11_04515 [Candidatus Omnitrophica bacterium]|nr:hypothetical protein [Candidatus Omnitrophota bacterium]